MSYGAEYRRVQAAARQVADTLDGHGDRWPYHLPAGAVVVDRDSAAVYDTVRLGDVDGTLLYRRAARWVVVGWSDASKARRRRPTPADLRPWSFDDHDDVGGAR